MWRHLNETNIQHILKSKKSDGRIVNGYRNRKNVDVSSTNKAMNKLRYPQIQLICILFHGKTFEWCDIVVVGVCSFSLLANRIHYCYVQAHRFPSRGISNPIRFLIQCSTERSKKKRTKGKYGRELDSFLLKCESRRTAKLIFFYCLLLRCLLLKEITARYLKA